MNKIWCPGFFLLQVLGKPFSIKDDHLVQHLIPVPITLRPFFDHVPTGKIEHLFQRTVTWKYTFGLGHFPVLAVKPLYDICSIHDAPDIIGELEEGADILPVVFPVTYRIGIFPSPFLFDLFQFRQCGCFIRGIIYRLKIRRKLLQVAVIDNI